MLAAISAGAVRRTIARGCAPATFAEKITTAAKGDIVRPSDAPMAPSAPSSALRVTPMTVVKSGNTAFEKVTLGAVPEPESTAKPSVTYMLTTGASVSAW